MNELRELRRAIGLGQRAFAALLSIPLETYRPWESRKRTPSPVLWERVEALGRARMDARRTPISSKGPAHPSNRLSTGGYEQPAADR
jgi:transcriptional regulator with XRE-family HTH domain